MLLGRSTHVDCPQKNRKILRPPDRHNSIAPEVLDGAMFSFICTTDPTLLVVVEVRKS